MSSRASRRARTWWIAILSLTLLPAGCVPDEGLCDAVELTSALNRAVRGDTIRVGACRVIGAFTVPEGVTLEGSGSQASFLASEGTAPVVTVRPATGSSVSRVRGLTIDSTGSAGVLIEGRGQVHLEQLRVRAAYGIGLGIERADQVRIRDVELLGPVTTDNLDALPSQPTPADIATYGLVLVGVAEAELGNLSVSGFASMGAVFVEANTTWSRGSSSNNRGVGLMVHGGSADLSNLELCGGLRGTSLVPVYGAVFVEGAQVRTSDLTVCRNKGIGLLHESCSAEHHGVKIFGNTEAGLWAQKQGTSIELAGFDLTDNGLGGLVFHESGPLIVHDGAIASTNLVSKMLGEARAVEMGDGVHLIRPQEEVRLRDLTLQDNARIGLLLQVEGQAPADLSLDGVEVGGAGEQLGAVAQGDQTAIPPGWDDAVSRSPELEANDREHEATGDPLSIVMGLEGANVPLADELEREGLGWLLGAFD